MLNSYFIMYENLKFIKANDPDYVLVVALVYLLAIIGPILIMIALATVCERHFLSAIHSRRGPNVVGTGGLLQAFADGLKLIQKEVLFGVLTKHPEFIMAPILAFSLATFRWSFIPLSYDSFYFRTDLSLFIIIVLGSIGVYSIIGGGWFSNSKYAFLGAIRSASQMISYEVYFSLIIATMVMSYGTGLDLLLFLQVWLYTSPLNYYFAFLPLCTLFFITMLAETNRPPFDLPEAEAELVSGYNVEYSGFSFSLFFLAEYGNMLLISALFAIFYFPLSTPFSFGVATVFLYVLLVLARGICARYRYDHLMSLGWRVFLPQALAFFIYFFFSLISNNGTVDNTVMNELYRIQR